MRLFYFASEFSFITGKSLHSSPASHISRTQPYLCAFHIIYIYAYFGAAAGTQWPRAVSLSARRRALFLAAIKYTLIYSSALELDALLCEINIQMMSPDSCRVEQADCFREENTLGPRKGKGWSRGSVKLGCLLSAPRKFYWGVAPIFWQWNIFCYPCAAEWTSYII